MDIDLRQSFAVTAGFGWYSLAPGIILERGLARCAAISFYALYYERILFITFGAYCSQKGRIHGSNRPLRRHCNGRLSAHCKKSTRGDVTIYSFISGLIQTVSVPILIPLILG